MKALIILLSGLFGPCISHVAFAQIAAPIEEKSQQRRVLAPQSTEKPMGQSSAPDGPCSINTLRGTYIFNFEGSIDSGSTQVRQSGVEAFDGKGHITSKVTTKRGSLATQSMETYSVTYTINPDCSGKLSDGNGPYADIFVDPAGSSFHYIFTRPYYLIAGETKRTSKRILSLAQ